MITKEQKQKVVGLASDMAVDYAWMRSDAGSNTAWEEYVESATAFNDYLDTLTEK